jgi:hypothetical protein
MKSFPFIPAILVALQVLMSTAFAGTKGAFVNSSGVGVAVNAVVFNGVTNTAKSISMLNPVSAVNIQTNKTFTNTTYTTKLPEGTPSSVFCQSRGGAPGVFSIQSYVTGGATADNPELEERLPVTAADCAYYALESAAQFTGPNSGTLIVNANASAGAAIWLRGFQYNGTGVPADLDELKANGTLKWDVLIAGPFEFSTTNCTALNIPFTFSGSDTNLYFVADGVAKSTPFTVTCAGNVSFGCADTVVYPSVQVAGGCGQVTITYNPPANLLPPTVSTVTVTATDEVGNSAQCSFVADNSAKGIPFSVTCPSNLVFTCSQTVAYPAAQISGGCGAVSVAYSPLASAIQPGTTNLVTVTATDSLGRTTQCSFSVIRQGLVFEGFYSPISGTGGSCGSPVRMINVGSTVPVKFKVSCSGSPVLTGQPSLSIKRCSNGSVVGGGNFNKVVNEWHFQWLTSGISKGDYELIATLQDGSRKSVFIRLK